MAAGAQPNPQQGPPPGVTLGPPVPQPPPGVSLGAPVAFSGYAGAPQQAAPANSATAVAPTPEPPANSWQRLKKLGVAGWMKENLAYNSQQAENEGGVSGAVDRTLLGGAKGLVQLGGFGAHLLANVSDQATPHDVLAYQQEHPGASVDDAMAAVSGKDAKGNPAPAYRAPDNREASKQAHEAAEWFGQAGTTHGFWEGLGNAGELLGESLGTGGLGLLGEASEGGEVAAKLPTIADKLKQVQQTATTLEKNKKLATLASIGLRTLHAAAKAGTEAAAQTYVHSQGDAGEAATAGVLGAGMGGAIDGGLRAGQAIVSHLAPEMREIAGRAVPVLRSQITRTAADGTPIRPSLLQQVAATTEDSPGVVGTQQAAAQDSIAQAAQGAVSDELGKVNASRVNPGNALPSSTEPYTFKIQGTPTAETIEGKGSTAGQNVTVREPSTTYTGTQTIERPNPDYDPARGVSRAGVRQQIGSLSDVMPDRVLGEPQTRAALTLERNPALPERVATGAPTLTSKEPTFSNDPGQTMHVPPPTGSGGTAVTRGGAVLETADPKLAQAHLESVNRIIGSDDFAHMTPEQQAVHTGQADDISRQLAEYHQRIKTQQPFRANFTPHDIPAAISATRDFGDAANILRATGKQVYDHLNAVSGGEWQALDGRITTLQEKYWQATGSARDEIGQALSEARGQVDDIFANPKSGVDRADLQAARGAWRSSYALRDLHNALQPSYDVDADFARRTGEYRGFNGQAALGRFRVALARNPELKIMLGAPTTDNLQSIFRLNSTMAGRARYGEGVSRIARWMVDRGGRLSLGAGAGLGYAALGAHGAAGGGAAAEALYGATRFVLHKLATNPAAGKSLLYALEYGARPENYADSIGRMIARAAVPTAASTAALQLGGSN